MNSDLLILLNCKNLLEKKWTPAGVTLPDE
ncbi:MAG: hypothetical protein QOE55_4117, partial [Acidobacteriaceae bacterium]|nr:hypothetical protein [Acidobacteriaceae bacterium]